jgi:hypothetical protein
MRITLLLLLALPSIALGQAGRFLLAAGEVTVVRGAQEIRAATGTPVEAGDTIRVGPRSNVQLRMSDRQIIALRANTVFRIDDYAYSGGGDGDRSIYSLLKGGMRTVSGAIARQHSDEFLRTSVRRDAPSGPQPAVEESKPDGERKLVDLAKAPLRRVAGVLTPMRHAVRVPTATIGVRGTHYTVVHCDNDCFETGRTNVPNGTYGATSEGLIEVFNDRDEREFGANSFFYVASTQSPIHSLIAPPSFVYDRLEGQERNRGLRSAESSTTMARSGVNVDSRPSETPLPPKLPAFVVTEVRSESGAPAVVPAVASVPVVIRAPSTAFLSALGNAADEPRIAGAFVDAAALATQDVLLAGFNLPAGSAVDQATGAYAGAAVTVVDQSAPNALNATWGIWFDGSVTDASGRTTVGTGKPLFHYLVGPNTPPEVVAAKRGTFAFDLVPGTLSASNNFGEIALPGTSMSATIDFDRRTASLDPTRLTFPSQTWNVSGSSPSPINIDARGASFQSTATGSCTSGGNSCNGPAQFKSTTIFMGPGADHLGHSFQGHAKSGGPNASMQGTAILSCKPSCP